MGKEPDKNKRLTIIGVVQSIVAAAFGVQSSRKRERDFREGRASHFLIAGFVFTVLLIGLLLTVVHFVVR